MTEQQSGPVPSQERLLWRFEALVTSPADDQLEREFLTVAGSLAVKCGHPAAREIDRVARASQLPHCVVAGFQDFGDLGFGGVVHLPGESGLRAALVGEKDFLLEAGLDLPSLLESAARSWEEEAGQVLFGGWDGVVRGIMRFSTRRKAIG